ncbi:hypothetical protein LTR37_006864 [Vermiconidia calcicola]|uniref:Uncharacterized protein n=1 Tax=Vermiconidia calcicola TaxID=1690605 RepID=A0ACC3NF67_9PEZI|nr:hypothetical protein LTR37_006864 [Vermiconidia calcicola]
MSGTDFKPRKSSLKKSKPTEVMRGAPGELQRVSVQIYTKPNLPPLIVEPAKNHIKHSLFCEPLSADQSTPNRGIPRRRYSNRRRSSRASSMTSTSPLIDLITPDSDVGRILPSPVHERPGLSVPPKAKLQRLNVPSSISTQPPTDLDLLTSPGGDTVSPLPDKTRFSNVSPRLAEFPTTQSLRSVSPTLARSNSTGTVVPPYSPPPMKSMFPEYDPTRPLQEQHYYPTARSPTPTLPNEKISKLGGPVEQVQTLQRLDSGVALVEGYEHIPRANSDDLLAIWNASCGIFPVPGRKVQLGLLQPRDQGTSLAVGTAQGEKLYSMDKACVPASSRQSKTPKQLFIKKHRPQDQTAPPSPVAQLALPEADKSNKDRESDVVSIFPQMAAVNAIANVANSPVAASIAYFDPAAKSPEAARLAQDAVAEAQNRHRCELIRTTRKRDSLGAVTATYRLEHPFLGSFAITVTKSTVGRHPRDPRAKISLHHPSATPAAVSAETLVLAFLDFSRDACVIDTPGLLALEGSYIIDTVICALLAVAVIENDAIKAETLTFDAPPKTPLPRPKQNSRTNSRQSSSSGQSKSSSRWSRRDRKKEKFEGEQVDLPIVTRGTLALLGFSFKTAVWVLEAGVKVTAGVVVGISRLASKA